MRGTGSKALARGSFATRAAGVIALFGSIGCGRVQHESFADFANSLQELRQRADDALELQNQWARERLIEETARDVADPANVELILNLQLEDVPGEPFGWTLPEKPLYLASRAFRQGIYDLNSVLLSYATLLRDLASADLITEAQFSEFAAAMNATLQTAADALKVPEAKSDIGLFSAAASEVLLQGAREQQRGYLQRFLTENQCAIERIAELARDGIVLVATSLRHEYAQRFNVASQEINPNEPMKATDRRRAVEEIVDLNDLTIGALNALGVLDAAYAALPAAHRELEIQLENPKLSLVAIGEFFESVIRLRRLYEEFAPPEPAGN